MILRLYTRLIIELIFNNNNNIYILIITFKLLSYLYIRLSSLRLISI